MSGVKMYSRQVLLNKFIKIKDDINKQIPLAANRYEDIETAPALPKDADNEQQLAFHDAQEERYKKNVIDNKLMMTEFHICEYINESFASFKQQQQISSSNDLTETHKELLKNLIISNCKQVVNKALRTQALLKKAFISDIDYIKRHIRQNMDSYVEQLVAGKEVTVANKEQAQRCKLNLQLEDVRDRYNRLDFDSAKFVLETPESEQQRIKVSVLMRGLYLEQIKTSTGYCDEHAYLALMRILNLRDRAVQSIELIHISYKDRANGHVFLAINRDPDSKLNHISTWGENAILFDAWNKLVCLASEFENQPIYFFSFPTEAEWGSIKFGWLDVNIIADLQLNNKYFQLTGITDLNKRIACLKDEYQLVSLEQEEFSHTKKFLYDLIEQLRPDNFNQSITIYVSAGDFLPVMIIQGFYEATIAITKDFLINLNEERNVEELKFALANAIYQIKRHGFGLTDELLAYEAFEIDKLALKSCRNWTAAQSYLRWLTTLKPKEKPLKIKSVDSNKKGLESSPQQRLKSLMTYIAQDSDFLNPNEVVCAKVSKRVIQEVEEIKRKKFIIIPDEMYTDTVLLLRYLADNLLLLRENELVPYELMSDRKPSARLIEFCKILKQIIIHWGSHEHRKAVDDFINKAFEMRVPGFDRLYSVLVRKSYSVENKKPRRFPKLGIFKTCQEKLTAFVNATSIDKAIVSANEFLPVYEVIRPHLYKLCDQGRVNKHIEKYRKENNDRYPTGRDRYFDSSIGAAITWEGFNSENASHVHDFIEWAGVDESGVIAKALFAIGIYKHPNILAKCSMTYDSEFHPHHIRTPKIKDVAKFKKLKSEHRGHQSTTVKKYIIEQHTLVMFRTDIPFEEAFKQFIDSNLPVLKINYDIPGLNKAAVQHLLMIFTYYALTGTDAEKKVIKSFFMGREDERDLYHLQSIADMQMDAPYLQFLFTQKYMGASFQLFTPKELITIHTKADPNSYFHKSNIPNNVLLNLLGLREDEGNLLNFVHILKCYQENGLFIDHRLIKTYMENFGVYHAFFSREVALLSEYIYKNCGGGDNIRREYYRMFQWNMPQNRSDLWQFSIEEVIILYRTADRMSLFPSYQDHQRMGQYILDFFQFIESDEERIVALEKLILNYKFFKHSLGDINFRDHVIKLWLASLINLYGRDDGKPAYIEKMKIIIDNVSKNSSSKDAFIILSRFADAIQSQREISEYIGILLEPERFLDARLLANRKQIYQLALSQLSAFSAYFSNSREDQLAVLDFLTSPLTDQSADKFTNYLIEHYNAKGFLDLFIKDKAGNSLYSYHELRMITLEKAYEFYHLFWDRPLNERVVMLDHLIIPANAVVTDNAHKKAYQFGMEYAAKKILPKYTEADSDDEFAYVFLQAYLAAADMHMRSLLLGGLLVVSNESTQQQEMGVGKKIALLCEHMGPAYIKLAQAIHSYPRTPEHIRRDLDHIKGRANPPYRWNLWRLLLDVLPDEQLAKIKRIGKLLGSASYNLALETTMKNGDEVVLLLLREDAENQSKQGFKHLHKSIKTCDHKKMDLVRESFITMLDQAKELSKSEMDYHISDQQNQIAMDLYDVPCIVNSDGIKYDVELKPSKTLKSGNGYRLITRVYGEEFNDLPETTIAEKRVKHAVALAIMQFELLNMLHGSYFDSDRHGNQLRIDVDNEHAKLKVGLYDFGEMSIDEPTQEDLENVRYIINHVIEQAIEEGSPEHVIDTLLAKQINDLSHSSNQKYLIRLRKALLALQDFQKYISRQELLLMLNNIATQHSDHIHPSIREDFLYLQLKMDILNKAYNVYQFISSGFGFFKQQDDKDASQDVGNVKICKYLK